MITISKERLDMLHASAIAWLRDEYAYQSQKFNEKSYWDSLEGSISGGAWGLARYVVREQLFRAGGADLQAVQAAGKAATGGRAVYTAVRRIHTFDRLSFDQLSRRSLAMLAVEDPRVWVSKGGIKDEPLEKNPLLIAIRKLESGLQRPIRTETMTVSDVQRSEEVCHEAMGYFMRRLVARDAHQPQDTPPILPRPGLPSGYTEAWQPLDGD